MRKAEYPQRTCRYHTVKASSGVTEYPCELPENHSGPPASLSVPESVAARDAWEEANPGHEKTSAFDDPFADIADLT